MKRIIASVFGLFLCLIFTDPAWALSSQNVVKLKKAGVSDQTIQVIVQEKVIETAAFSIEDIVEMKQAGVGDKTLQMLIKEGSFLRNSRPIVYGKDTRPIRFTTAGDVIALKQAGLSDEVIQAVIAVTGERYYSQREESLDLLRGMGIVVDSRQYGRGRKGDR